ncbi:MULTISPECIES: iron-containing alcohol dehydrogenase [unclassified Pseudovibrio]|uniref:iron-containing alcohol dehydrogenase n=1 Tax=unclassified Pseudovibrio TaxID=2627060 RepID=UPI0007AEE42E|nr:MULTISPECIES: iron-containing alcohol dehydrogenase [unclassified Pseudovibrio]KZL00313.1 Alcohol dehydrogenase YqhD [Pseudovibrio sp. W74]KZL07313.1 Alcohol dehydrogenase YqhD [Pseudovibrio sp. Ad14]
MKFNYQNPTKLLFGQGKISEIRDQIPTGSRILLAYGGGSIKANGVYEQALSALEGFTVVEFSGIEANPHFETLEKAVELVKEQDLDFILAVGGGSVVDGCKFVAAAAHYDGDHWDIPSGKHRIQKATPLASVLTLPATGSESNGNSVITRKSTGEKLAFGSPLVFPVFSVLDPDTMKTLPERQLRNGLIDAFVHVCEQYLTFPTGALVQDGYAEALLRTLVQLGKSYPERDTDEWRANLMYAANQGLNGLISSGVPQDWATHQIGHELTACFGIDHAQTLSIIQPSLLRSQIELKRAKLEQMGTTVFSLPPSEDLAEKTIDAIEEFYQQLAMPIRLSDANITDQNDIDTLMHIIESRDFLKAIGEHGKITPNVIKDIVYSAR